MANKGIIDICFQREYSNEILCPYRWFRGREGLAAAPGITWLALPRGLPGMLKIFRPANWPMLPACSTTWANTPSNSNGDLKGEKIRVDHSTAGAQEAERIYGKALGRILAYVVAGHHAGLQDYGSLADEASLAARLNKRGHTRLPGLSRGAAQVAGFKQLPPAHKTPCRAAGLQPGFFIRMLYSCLVDADFLDTEEFCQPERGAARGKHPPLVPMLQKLDQYLQQMLATVPDTPINRERAAILDQCREKASLPPGLFTLTVPTGGGKTLSPPCPLPWAMPCVMDWNG